MKNSIHRYSRYSLILAIFIVGLFLIQGWGGNGFLTPGKVEAKITPETIPFEEEPVILDKTNPHIRAVMAIQNRHTPGLMGRPDVVGTATGLTEDGRPAILVFTKKGVGPGVIPESLEGTPVVVKVTGEIVSMARPPWAGGPEKDNAGIDPTSRFERPVPIGVSTGNAGECLAGTIGARVKKSDGSVYALSNNHVYALQNNASDDSEVLQPGLYDTSCTNDSGNVIGTLSAYVRIDFDVLGGNIVDAAIARSSTSDLGKATPSDGYGTPKSTIVPEEIGQRVQKYGRTTSLTKGEIDGINATFIVSYDVNWYAWFFDQIVVKSRKPFMKPGDSGSLLVTDPGRYPVGLLFAGSSDGKTAIANPIDEVLTSLDVSIDGE